MAIDNSPRLRQKAKLARKKPSRQPFDRVLIVTEGTKTEPNYFDEIRQALRLPSTHIEITPSGFGTDPVQIVQFAEQRLARRNDVDCVFCVFDRDQHQGFHNALKMAASKNGKLKNDEGAPIRFEAVESIPCFEYWLLLHFEDAFGHLERTEAFERLKGHIPGYAKGAKNVFDTIRDRLPHAVQRASFVMKSRQRDGAENPSTRVGVLVEYLVHLTREVDR